VCHKTGKHVEGFTTAALARLCAYPWPGNVRELQNLIERLVILGDGGWIDVDALPDPYAAPGGFRIPTAPRLPQNGITFRDEVARFEANLLQQALERTDWNKTKAAALLGLNRTTLLEMIRARGIEPPEPEPG
jgi:DNA-binding NtrC family response regulator